jgi:hypothetical protein
LAKTAQTIETVKREINEESTSAVLSTAVSFTKSMVVLYNLLLFQKAFLLLISSMVFL